MAAFQVGTEDKSAGKEREYMVLILLIEGNYLF